MAAYAGVVSLMNTMEQIQNHPCLSSSFDRTQMESLREKAAFLLDFIERDDSHGGMSKKEVEGLESQIASAAHEAEDVIEFHIVHQIQERTNSVLDLQQVIKYVDSVKEKVSKVKRKWGCNEEQPTYSTPATLSRPVDTGKSTMVGFDNDDILTEFMEMLIGKSSSCQVIPVVGMGGIGKTTLARNVYESSLIVEHFDVRAWATISQAYDECQIISELLSCLTKSPDATVDELGEQLHKTLCGRRYLIILDDVWSIEVWYKIKFYFPNDCNGSRIAVTTRLSNVSTCFGSSFFEMKFLDENRSWNLLCEKAFGLEDCPPKLVKIGKKIAKRCKGLPLSIVVIGGLLRRSNKSKTYWEKVAKNISSILSSGEDEQCTKVLSLSYSQLPPRLKPCFLYMGVFQEDEEICASELIKLWVGEGFLKPKTGQSLEEVAESCLRDLIERNLILVRRLGLNQKVKTCCIHDLLRKLCLSVAKKEKFFMDTRVPTIPQGNNKDHRRFVVQNWRRLGVYDVMRLPSIFQKYLHHLSCFWHRGPPLGGGVYDALESASFTRSLICDGGPLPCTFPLLRVLTNVDDGSLEDILKHVNLRYLSYKFSRDSDRHKLPPSICLLWNVQTLIVRGVTVVDAPSKIWEMRQLRHLESDGLIYVPQPPPNHGENDLVLQNLQTLVNVINFRLSYDVCKRIPNLRKLHLRYDECSEYYCLNNLGQLRTLQSLNFIIYKKPRWCEFVETISFPSSLHKLSLTGCCLDWEGLTRIGFSLPHLEVLKLEHDSVVGPKWDLVEGAFPSLKFLKICCQDLVYWTADDSHFPVLEELFLCGLGRLFEIPLDMVGISTLQCIRLEYCSSSAAKSAEKILEEQLDLGNDDFQVRASFVDEKDSKRFRKEVASKRLLKEVDRKASARKNFERKEIIAKIRNHAQAIRAAALFQTAGQVM